MVRELRAYRASSLGELLAARDLANTTVECLLDPVIVVSKDGALMLTNAAAERTFGLRTGSLDELRVEDVRLPREFEAALTRVFRAGENVAPQNFREAMRWHGRDGERYYLVRAAPLGARDGASGPSQALLVAQDVTRFRRIDDLKSGMVATVSHEFKTPLTSLRMATHLLLEPATGPLTEAQRDIVTTARDDTERLRALVDELLDLVRIEAEAGELHRVPIEPPRLLQAAAEGHRAIAREKHVALEIARDVSTEPVDVDPGKLAIVLANLVSNAIRHTPPGGRVTLAAAADDGVTRITVRDTGEGITTEQAERLLEPGSSRALGTGGGRGQHGLGLSIAREIVLQHGGELSVQSAVGQGSEFTVVLPRPRPSTAVAPPGTPL
jgi:PAS domain S-box-containing protein